MAEFSDKTTGDIAFQPGFLPELEALRIEYNRPIFVTDGCRSDAQVEYLIQRGYAASKNSFHLMKNKKYSTKTCALDMARPNAIDLHRFLGIALARGWTVGIGFTFLHIDLRGLFASPAMSTIVYSYQSKK